MAQPAWKTGMESAQPTLQLQQRQPVSSLPGLSPLTTVVEEDDTTSAAARLEALGPLQMATSRLLLLRERRMQPKMPRMVTQTLVMEIGMHTGKSRLKAIY